MKNKSIFHKWSTYIIPIILLLYFVFVFFYARTVVSDKEIANLILSALIPFILSIISSIYFSSLSSSELQQYKDEMESAINKIPYAVNHQTIICHGTKHEVPDGEKFWNGLLIDAQNKFFLIGRSNKSWIAKSQQQKEVLGLEIIRIITNGGEIKIMSDNNPKHIQHTHDFFQEYVLKKLVSNKQKRKIIKKIKTNICYCTGDVNYSAVIADTKLLILPNLNSHEFRERTMVLEVSQHTNPKEYTDYISDIGRTFEGKPNLMTGIIENFEINLNESPKKYF